MSSLAILTNFDLYAVGLAHISVALEEDLMSSVILWRVAESASTSALWRSGWLVHSIAIRDTKLLQLPIDAASYTCQNTSFEATLKTGLDETFATSSRNSRRPVKKHTSMISVNVYHNGYSNIRGAQSQFIPTHTLLPFATKASPCTTLILSKYFGIEVLSTGLLVRSNVSKHLKHVQYMENIVSLYNNVEDSTYMQMASLLQSRNLPAQDV